MNNLHVSDEWGAFTSIPNEFIDCTGGLSDQAKWLFVLWRRLGSWSFDLLQEKTGWTPEVIAQALKELEEMDWVEHRVVQGTAVYVLKRDEVV